MASIRKPYNDRAGYVASLRSGASRGWVVIYEAEQQGIDTGTRYATVCESHGEIVGDTSLKKARLSLKSPSDWCEGCRS